MQLYNEATWSAVASFGLGESGAAAGRAASMAVEHHVRYLREVHVDDVVACHVRVLGRPSKAPGDHPR